MQTTSAGKDVDGDQPLHTTTATPFPLSPTLVLDEAPALNRSIVTHNLGAICLPDGWEACHWETLGSIVQQLGKRGLTLGKGAR